MRYEKFEYLWPPRPENAIAADMLSFYEKRRWISQFKCNGTCSVIAVSPDRKLVCKTRHHTDHKLWSPSEQSSAIFRNLPGNGWNVFVAELMHSKVPGLRDINYINDILVADGERLDGTTFSDRQEILRKLFLNGDEEETISHYVLDDNAWLAKNHTAGFSTLFSGIDKPEHEGLVLKNPKSVLLPCIKPTANAGWSVKLRRPTKNYAF